MLAPRLTFVVLALGAVGCGDEVLRTPVRGAADVTADELAYDPWDGATRSDDWRVPELPTREPEWEALFALDTIKTLELAFTLEEWNALLHDYDAYPRNELARRAALSIAIGTSTVGATVVDGVGVRVRGNVFSRERPESGVGPHDLEHVLQRTHLKVKLDETFDGDESVYGSPAIATSTASDGRSLFGVRAFNLKVNRDDPSYLREVVAYALFRRAGVEAPRATFARLFVRIGAEPARYLGVYSLVEDVDATWIRRRFAGQSSTLFKCLWQAFGPADLTRTDEDGDMTRGRIGVERTDPATPEEGATWSDDRSYRPAYDLKTNRAHGLDAANALNALVRLLAGRPTKAELRAAIDVEALLRAMVVNAFVGMSDDYWRNGNNYYLLQRPDDQRWMFIPFDYDRSFGVETVGPPEATSSFLAWGQGGNVRSAPLATKPLGSPQLRRDYLDYVARLAGDDDALLAWLEIEPLFTTLQALIEPHVHRYEGDDPYPFDPDLSAIEAFVSERAARARSESSE